MPLRTAGTAFGGLLGGCVGDAAAKHWPLHGRIAVTQASAGAAGRRANAAFKVGLDWGIGQYTVRTHGCPPACSSACSSASHLPAWCSRCGTSWHAPCTRHGCRWHTELHPRPPAAGSAPRWQHCNRRHLCRGAALLCAPQVLAGTRLQQPTVCRRVAAVWDACFTSCECSGVSCCPSARHQSRHCQPPASMLHRPAALCTQRLCRPGSATWCMHSTAASKVGWGAGTQGRTA